MASYRKRGKTWYYRFVDADGVKRECKGCTDRRATEAIAAAEAQAAKVRSGYIDPKAPRYLAHEACALAEHLEAFRAMLAAKGGTARHTKVTVGRAGRVLELAKARRISDLSLSRATAALAQLRSEDLSQETVNHHIRAVKAFSRWLWKDGRAREHNLAHLATSNPEADRRRRRRALTREEATRLVCAAEAGPVVGGMAGPDRAILYALALGTGFRAEELATLTPDRFDLDSIPPTATVDACYAKNGREAVQPLPRSLVARLAPWLASKPVGRPVFAGMTKRTAEMLRTDLEAADIPYETASGVVDFHALRGTYISHLVSSGASVKTCQTLARHSTPSLTIGIYAKASLHDIAGAVEALPDLTDRTRGKPERSVATGTHGRPISQVFAHHLPTEGDGVGRDGSDSDATTPRAAIALGIAPEPGITGPDGPGRSGSDCRRWESNPHGGSPPEDFKSPASAVPPRRRAGGEGRLQRRGWDSNPRKV